MVQRGTMCDDIMWMCLVIVVWTTCHLEVMASLQNLWSFGYKYDNIEPAVSTQIRDTQNGSQEISE